MKELLSTAQRWISENKPFAIATVIKTWGSSPRPIGSSLIVSADMEMAGSVSGGCVEGAVIKAAMPVIESGEGKLLSFGVTDEEAWQVGLSCGGKIQVYIERFVAFENTDEGRAVWNDLPACLSQNKATVLVTKLNEGPSEHSLVFSDGSFKGQDFGAAINTQVIKAYRERKTQVIEVEEELYFAQVFARKSQLLIIGAAHITVDLVTLANLYDFETIVIDPRGAFTNKTQFVTSPDQIFEKYPEEILNNYTLDAYSYAVVLSHDPKIDDNALQILLRSDVAYIGALGSRKTQAKRVARLTEAGFSESEIAKIHAPIGLDINAKKPREIALSIMSEIIKTQNAYL